MDVRVQIHRMMTLIEQVADALVEGGGLSKKTCQNLKTSLDTVRDRMEGDLCPLKLPVDDLVSYLFDPVEDFYCPLCMKTVKGAKEFNAHLKTHDFFQDKGEEIEDYEQEGAVVSSPLTQDEINLLRELLRGLMGGKSEPPSGTDG